VEKFTEFRTEEQIPGAGRPDRRGTCIEGKIASISEKEIIVVFEQSSSCKSCGMQYFCHQQTMSFEREEYPGNFEIGQRVELIYKKIIRTALIVYAIPLAGFFIGIWAGYQLTDSKNEIILFTGSLIGTGIGLLLVAWLNRQLAGKKYRVLLKQISQFNN